MPLGNILAAPFAPSADDHERVERRRLQRLQEYDDSEELEEFNNNGNDTLISKQTMLRIKVFELVFTIGAIVCYIYAKSQTHCINVDLLISGFFGALLMYPLIILSIPKHDDLGVSMMIMNLMSSLMLFSNGYFIFSSWYELKSYLIADAIMPGDPIAGIEKFQFFSATFSFIIGTFYASEVFVQLYDNIRRIL